MSPISFDLPLYTLVSPNVLLRMHHRNRSSRRAAIAWELVAAIRPRPASPIPRAAVVITRHAPRPLDPDNLTGACKLLLDCLQPPSKRHPAGLGIIASDAAADLDLTVRQIPCPACDARVSVEILPSSRL